MKITTSVLLDAAKKIGAKISQKTDFLNIIGIRTKDNKANTFNDWICVLFKHAGEWVLLQFPATTDPGVYYRENPANVKGTAIVKPGFHRGVWILGMHQGRYKALVQHGGEITVFRDNDKNAELDITGIREQTGYFGINLHRANANTTSKIVGKFSAGCQVIASPHDYQILMALVSKHCALYGAKTPAKFDFTLLTEADIDMAAKANSSES